MKTIFFIVKLTLNSHYFKKYEFLVLCYVNDFVTIVNIGLVC